MGRMNLRQGALALAAGIALLAGGAQAQNLRMASLGQASPTTVFSIALSQAIKKDYGYSTQLTTGAVGTRMIVDAANQQLDLFMTAVSINGYLRDGTRMYEQLPNAKDLFTNIRSIVNYPLGAYHGITWADSGIESMADLKGKKVYIGPSSSAGRTVITQVIKGVTGYEPDVDFTPVNLDWASAEQAFQDRQVDAYFVPTPIPSAELQQISAIGEFRVLGIPDDKLDDPSIKAAAAVPGREFDMLEPGTYKNLVNDTPVRMVSSIVGLGTNKWMDEEVIYNVTKAIFDHHEDFVAAAKWMEVITPESALNQMNAPLHVGAYRYYKEIGVDVPEDLIPPEAK